MEKVTSLTSSFQIKLDRWNHGGECFWFASISDQEKTPCGVGLTASKALEILVNSIDEWVIKQSCENALNT